jgi:hydrogenase expression/formation protein HypC
MCLAVPGRIIELEGIDPAFRSATVDFCGVRKQVSLAFTPEASTGDFVLVHVGFAITRIDEEEAKQTFRYLREIGALKEEGIEAEGIEDAGIEDADREGEAIESTVGQGLR